jgi:hypothetical protein
MTLFIFLNKTNNQTQYKKSTEKKKSPLQVASRISLKQHKNISIALYLIDSFKVHCRLPADHSPAIQGSPLLHLRKDRASVEFHKKKRSTSGAQRGGFGGKGIGESAKYAGQDKPVVPSPEPDRGQRTYSRLVTKQN